MKSIIIITLVFFNAIASVAQQMPSIGENVSCLVTFGKDAKLTYGDDDFSQTIFLLIPKNYTSPFYIRIFDPEISGKLDEINDENNTTTIFSVYGGKGAFSDSSAQSHDPIGNYKSGILLSEKTFSNESEFDEKWYSYGPFNPLEGEYVEHFKARIFKIIIEGQSGDDGNLYRFFLSSEKDKNYPIKGSNLFTYEYSIRLLSKPNEIAHLYPFIDDSVKSVKLHNFDFDNDGEIRLFSVAKNGHNCAKSGDGTWAESVHFIDSLEKGTSLNVQIIKKGAWDNDLTFYITNQYDKDLPFFSIPIGGIPKYKYKVHIKYLGK